MKNKEEDTGSDTPLCVIVIVIFTIINIFVMYLSCMYCICVNIHNQNNNERNETRSVQCQTDILDKIPKIIVHPNQEINIAL